MPRTRPPARAEAGRRLGQELVEGYGWKVSTQVSNVVTFDRIEKLPHPEDCHRLHGFLVRTVRARGNSAVWCTTGYCMKAMGWSKGRTKRCREELRSAGLIEDRKTRSADGRRLGRPLLAVNFVPRFSSGLDSLPVEDPGHKYKAGLGTGEKSRDELRPGSARADHEDSDREAADTASPSIAERTGAYLPTALGLVAVVAGRRNVKVSKARTSQWANEMRLLAEVDGVGLPRQEEALRWYSEHCGDEYVPVIESGSSFRQKFLRLEAAMERDRRGRKRPRPADGQFLPPDRHPEVSTVLRPACLNSTDRSETAVRALSAAIVEFHGRPSRVDPRWYERGSRSVVGTPRKMASLLLDWLDEPEQGWVSRPVSARALRPDGELFRQFAAWVDRKYYDVSLSDWLLDG